MYYYCSINLQRQSEHSGLRPDTSSLVYFKRKWFWLMRYRLSYFSFCRLKGKKDVDFACQEE